MSDIHREAQKMLDEPKRRGALVRDRDGDVWKRGNTRWTCQTPIDGKRVQSVGRLPFYALVSMYGPLTIVEGANDAR